MLWTLIAILVVLWIIGMATHTLLGGLIHILLAVAVVVLIVRLVQGRRPVV